MKADIAIPSFTLNKPLKNYLNATNKFHRNFSKARINLFISHLTALKLMFKSKGVHQYCFALLFFTHNIIDSCRN